MSNKIFKSESSFFVFDKDLNYANSLFGGKLMAEIDCEAAKVAREIAYKVGADNAVTVNFHMDFKHPGNKGDLIKMYAVLSETGNTSVKIEVKCYASNKEGEHYMGIGYTTFVIMKDSKPFKHGL
jgi:acyl-CoA hydrolase